MKAMQKSDNIVLIFTVTNITERQLVQNRIITEKSNELDECMTRKKCVVLKGEQVSCKNRRY